MATANLPAAEAHGCVLRRLTPGDAAGTARLVRAVYGESYYPPLLYDPERIERLNQANKLVSIVAVHETAGVVGHYAVERLHAGAVAEASDAIVAVEFRHHHLMEEMRVLLQAEARRLELAGLVGYPVTNHLYSQKADEHFGAHPCGVAPGLWPKSFHNLPEALPQRLSFIVYFTYLTPAPHAVHVATPHGPMLERIARQWNVPVRACAAAAPTGPGELTVEEERPVETATIRVHRVGTDSATALRAAQRQAIAGGARAVALELPLAQPATAELCRAAEQMGFFFCGLGPEFARDGDALLMQWLADELDWSLIQVENPLARDLLNYARQAATAARDQ
jgi:hypothetical protein